MKVIIAFVISVCVLIVSAICAINTSETGYKVYLSDMSLEEFETEYEVTDIDGLILKAYKKGE